MTTEPISKAYLQSVCVSMCIPSTVVRQLLDEHVPAATNTRNNRRILGHVIFYAVRVLSEESLWVSLSSYFS
jgi:hypothetical protein